eukprot:gene12702-biopygen2635
MGTYAHNGDPCCDASNWDVAAKYAAGKTRDPATRGCRVLHGRWQTPGGLGGLGGRRRRIWRTWRTGRTANVGPGGLWPALAGSGGLTDELGGSHEINSECSAEA